MNKMNWRTFIVQENKTSLVNACNFAGVTPAMVQLPYPQIKVKERNQSYANLLSIDAYGSVSELSAITQYLSNESYMSNDKCTMAKTILGIAMAEMMHLQKLGELIILLGGSVDFSAQYKNGKHKLWTPAYLALSTNIKEMLLAGIEAERSAINQYNMHIQMMDDQYVIQVLQRIIKDEEYHIMILQALLCDTNEC